MDNHTRILLGLTDEKMFFPENWLREETVEGITTTIITGTLSYTPDCCRKCGEKNDGKIIKHGYHKTKIQLVPFRSKRTLLEMRRSRFLCKHCGSTFNAQTSFVEENCYLSKELKQKIILELANNCSRKDIAKRYFVSDVTVKRLMLQCVQQQMKPNFNYLPSVLCFDEFRSVHTVEDKMSFIFMNGELNKIIGILRNRRLNYLKTYFYHYSRKARAKVKFIVMDMNAPYFELAKTIFPNAEIITDRFHIVQHINRSLNQLRIHVMNKHKTAKSKIYRHLKRFWRLLLKDSFTLNSSNYSCNYSFRRPMTEKAIVDELLSYDDSLKLAYDTHQLLLYYFHQKDSDSFFSIIYSLDKRLPEDFRKKLTFFKRYRQGIKNALQMSYSNGPLEGTNNKIKVMKRVA